MITSTSNEKIKRVSKLLKSSQERRNSRQFVVEGERICSEIPADRFVEGYVSEEYIQKSTSKGASLKEVDGFVQIGKLSFMLVSSQVYKKMSDTVSGQGILAVVKQKKLDPIDFVEEYEDSNLKLLLLENIQDPGNLGTMIRTAEAAGFDGIITDGCTVDVYNPKVIRSTMGGIFRMPVMASDDFVDMLSELKIRDVNLFGAILDGSVDYREADYGNRFGILIGNEGNGLSAEAQKLVDTRVRIPMAGEVESLNAAVAAAVIMYRTIE